MNRSDLERIYRDELHPTYATLAARMNVLLRELTMADGIDVAQIEHRVKDIESVLGKYDRKKYEDPLKEIKDFAGVRVITITTTITRRWQTFSTVNFSLIQPIPPIKCVNWELPSSDIVRYILLLLASHVVHSESGVVFQAFPWKYRYVLCYSTLGLLLVTSWIIRPHLKLQTSFAASCFV